MRTREARAAINRTVKILDRKIPKWRRLIDKETLNIGCCNNCVTSQIFGDYYKGLEELGISEDEAEHYGLFLDIEPETRKYDLEYARLTSLWLEKI